MEIETMATNKKPAAKKPAARKTNGSKKPKTQPKSKKAAAAAAAAVKPAGKLPPVKLKHNTDRYAKYGHGKDEASTRTTERRYGIMDLILSGNATLGSIKSEFGQTGLKNVARHLRFSRCVVRGVTALESAGKLDPAADKKLAETLATMSPTTKIGTKADMPRLCSER